MWPLFTRGGGVFSNVRKNGLDIDVVVVKLVGVLV
jgi:hypothetical protein